MAETKETLRREIYTIYNDVDEMRHALGILYDDLDAVRAKLEQAPTSEDFLEGQDDKCSACHMPCGNTHYTVLDTRAGETTTHTFHSLNCLNKELTRDDPRQDH